jgi:hypothetical protein
LIFGCEQKLETIPTSSLSSAEIGAFKQHIVRYFEGEPKDISYPSTKWDRNFDEYYNSKARSAELLHYYKSKDGYVYFAVAKVAPSLILKKVATIGKLKLERDSIVYYEEICRTWKMEMPELKEKSEKLFQLIVKGKDVSSYYTKNSQPEFWIEFPDDMNFYSTEERQWKMKEVRTN